MSLTPRQSVVLAAIERLTAVAGYPPTIREIAKETHLSNVTVRGHLESLKTRGAISRATGTARGIRINHAAYK